MKPVKLDVNDLEVEAFATQDETPVRGTVRAHGPTDTCLQRICGGTAGGDDNGTCDWTCAGFGDTCQMDCPTNATYPGCA